MTVKAISFVAKSGTGKTTLLENDPTLLAVASNEPLKLDVPVPDLNNAGAIAGFIEEKFLK